MDMLFLVLPDQQDPLGVMAAATLLVAAAAPFGAAGPLLVARIGLISRWVSRPPGGQAPPTSP
jgi:hypothetical protein